MAQISQQTDFNDKHFYSLK